MLRIAARLCTPDGILPALGMSTPDLHVYLPATRFASLVCGMVAQQLLGFAICGLCGSSTYLAPPLPLRFMPTTLRPTPPAAPQGPALWLWAVERGSRHWLWAGHHAALPHTQAAAGRRLALRLNATPFPGGCSRLPASCAGCPPIPPSRAGVPLLGHRRAAGVAGRLKSSLAGWVAR